MDNQVFRQKIESTSTETPEVKPELKETPGKVEKDETIQDFDTLEEWKGKRGVPYASDYFAMTDLMSDFQTKMLASKVDKGMEELLGARGLDKTTANFRKLLDQVENEINSKSLQLFKRIEKLTNYFQLLRKIRDMENEKKKYAGISGAKTE